jgi:capsular polysaccharide transport system ATP-binding protein
VQQKFPIVHAERVTRLAAQHKTSIVIFDEMTVTLPTDRICAVLGKQGSGRSTFLRLLAGAERPNSGEILTQVEFSIVCNATNFFNPGMTGFENIKLAARMHGLDAAMLTELTLGASSFGADWDMPAGQLPGQRRKLMEMLVAVLLPFDCYLVDDLERVDPNMLILILEILRSRGAGMIFTAKTPKFVRQIATFAGIIANHTVYAFESVDEALKQYA